MEGSTIQAAYQKARLSRLYTSVNIFYFGYTS